MEVGKCTGDEEMKRHHTNKHFRRVGSDENTLFFFPPCSLFCTAGRVVHKEVRSQSEKAQ
jgi:hypothetical protein